VANTTNNGREMNQQVRSRVIKQPHNISLFNQVVFATSRHEDFDICVCLQFLYYKTSEKSCAARNGNSLVREFYTQSKINSFLAPDSRGAEKWQATLALKPQVRYGIKDFGAAESWSC